MTSARAMREAILDLIELLPDDATDTTRFDFGDEARTDWSYFPKEMIGGTFHGLPLGALTPTLQKKVYGVVEVALSPHAFGKVNAIRGLEPVLDARENHKRTELRDSLRYFLAIFGEPDATGTWGWRFEGHHVSISHTIVDDRVVSSTPLFFGSNPAEIRHGSRTVIKPLAEEEDAGRTLLNSLDEDQQRVAILDPIAPIDVVVPNLAAIPNKARPGDPAHPLKMFQDAFEALPEETKDRLALDLSVPKGVPYFSLDGVQKATMDDLVDVYISRLPEDLAATEVARIDAAGREDLFFAWAGSTERRGPHYYRIQGPDLLIEYDCVQDDANHIHAVWRNPSADLGGDVLRAHRATEH